MKTDESDRQTSASAELGNQVDTFRASAKPYYILLGVAGVCLLVSGLAIWHGLDRYYAPPGILDEMSFGASARTDTLVVGLLISVVNTLIALGCAAAAWFQRTVRLDVHQQGFVSRRGGRRLSAKWNDVKRVIEHKHKTRSSDGGISVRSTRYYVVVQTRDGREILLRGLDGVRRAGQLIATKAGVPVSR